MVPDRTIELSNYRTSPEQSFSSYGTPPATRRAKPPAVRRQAHSELISLALEHCGRTQLLLELSVARAVNGTLYSGHVDRLPVCEVHWHLILIGNSMLVEYLLVC